jgi:methylmalonic aciduria homocystinuria type C protein
MVRRKSGSSDPPWKSAAGRVGERCREAGLDLVHPFCLAWYNANVDGAERIDDLGRPDALALVVGNTRALWPRFVASLQRRAALTAADDPVDSYVVEAVTAALDGVDVRHQVHFGHVTEPAAVPIQKLAVAAGLAHLSPSHLSIHPEHGPWIALRALVVLDVEGPDGPRPSAPDPCTPCDKPCVEALERALELTGQSGAIEPRWEAWLAVRDACPQGRASRYSDDQVRYHYTKLRRLLPHG